MPPSALDGAPNFRDLGGHRTEDGQTVRSGLVFRSGHLANVTDADLDRLNQLGIKKVIDFRPRTEQEMTGYDRLPRDAEYIGVPIGDPDMAPHVKHAIEEHDFTVLPDLAVANRTLVREFAPELGRLLEMASHRENLPIIFHCIGGKDRTGMAAALLLTVLGVPWDAVRDDYLRSNGRLGGTVTDQDAFLEAVTGRYTDTPLSEENLAALRRFFVLEPEYIEAARDEIRLIAGSFDVYVRDWLGLSDTVIDRLRTGLLEPASE
jgi:protein-tyrosine phosphatase